MKCLAIRPISASTSCRVISMPRALHSIAIRCLLIVYVIGQRVLVEFNQDVGDAEFGPEYIERVRAKHVSTLEMIPENEFERGLEAMEQHVLSQKRHPTRFHLGTLVTLRRS